MTVIHEWTDGLRDSFERQILEDERSAATRSKYLHDLDSFLRFCGENKSISKDRVLEYKEYLQQHYAVSSVNSMLAALNSFFRFAGWQDCTVKALKVQREAFRPESKELTREDYIKLLRTAQGKGNERLYLLMMCICCTGIRISELPFITIEAVQSGQAKVTLKGKSRIVLLPSDLRQKLLAYATERKIVTGSIFITRSGKPMDRSNILHSMKRLGKKAGVPLEKIFPHNLRHLFAVVYYSKEKDLAHLADVLGHSNINTTRIYTLVSSETQSRTIDQLGLVL